MTHDALRVRTAEPGDGDELFRMATLLATSAVPERQRFDASLAAMLNDRRQCLLVAATPAGLTGYLHGLVHPAFHANGTIGWVEEVFVDEASRHTGLGRRLMEGFERWAGEDGARYFAVATRRAEDFYRSIGYDESAIYFKKDAGTG